MRHPKITDWADYVRAVADDGDRAALQQHLDHGCTLCEATVVALQRVAETAAADRALAIPDGTVRSVKALFAAQHPAAHGFWSELRLRIATARAGETLEQLSERTGNVWDLNETAVSNALFIGDILQEGQLVKIARRERYQPVMPGDGGLEDSSGPVHGPLRPAPQR